MMAGGGGTTPPAVAPAFRDQAGSAGQWLHRTVTIPTGVSKCYL